jgi:hypothetical protein
MHEIAVEHQHAARFTGRGVDAAFLHEPRHRIVVERP